MLIRKYKKDDISQMINLWNEVVEDGIAFPQEDCLDEETGAEFFASQSYCGVAVDDNGEVVGLYILHPNNVGRCGHICNASYAVSSKCRGQHIGEKLVLDCIARAKEIGFKIQRCCREQYPRPASVRENWIHSARRYPEWLSDEGRTL